jgi:hypothetical protein
MLLRICLIMAIVAGLGVIGVSQFVLRPQIVEIIDTRDTYKREWDNTKTELTKTKKSLKETSEKLAKTETSLEETKVQLVATTGKFEAEQKKSASLQQNIDKLRGDLKVAMDDLAAWTNMGLRVEQVRGVIDEAKNLQIAVEALRVESKLLVDTVKKQEKRIIELTSDKQEDPLVPAQVRGKVLVVDPKWDFLVLDVGKKQEVPERGVLLVSRNGELVAKVRVTTTQDQRSIANIMPGWKLKDVMEGDIVLPY